MQLYSTLHCKSLIFICIFICCLSNLNTFLAKENLFLKFLIVFILDFRQFMTLSCFIWSIYSTVLVNFSWFITSKLFTAKKWNFTTSYMPSFFGFKNCGKHICSSKISDAYLLFIFAYISSVSFFNFFVIFCQEMKVLNFLCSKK